jgi:ssDNA-binding replication factor A large subunit
LYAGQTFCALPRSAAVRSPFYEKVKDLMEAEAFEGEVEAVIQEWGTLLDRDAAAMIVVERHGRSVASFARIANLEEGMEANLRASVTGITPVRSFTRQDGTPGRVVNLELRDDSGFCRFVLWDEDVGLIERGKVVVGSTVRALDCYVKRTNFGLDVGRGKFGTLVVEAV